LWWLKELSIRNVKERVIPNLRYLPLTEFRRCKACHRATVIVALGPNEEFHLCIRCRANLRYELLAGYLRQAFPNIEKLDILELDYRSPLQPLLAKARNYTRSFYRGNVEPGTVREDGAVCQDITRLTFADSALDLIVSSDVLEHVPDAAAAFRESARVLRPGGAHVFTVPPRPSTRKRASLERGQPVHLVEPEYHYDPLDPAGILTYWDYGPDIATVLPMQGVRFDIVAGPKGSAHRIVWRMQKLA
jgi:SAM-dependent methyltransferase